MQNVNSYFTLEIKEDQVYMNFYPPVSGGELLKIAEVMEILDKNQVEGYDIKEINDVITKSTEPVQFRISGSKIDDFDESMVLKITPDGMYAIARFFPGSVNGKRMSKQEILSDLEYNNVVYGIKDDVIDRQIENPEYFKNIILALGVKPVQGKDGVLHYCFNTDRKARPKVNEDGTVDFHQLDNIAHVKRGDMLAFITPAEQGTSGMNVYGKEVRPERVRKVKFKYGNNIELSKDGLHLYSMVDGCATLEGDKIFVANLYDIPNDVDNSTGDVEFSGSILVHGNVRTGFRLRAAGNIEVFGVVEGAELEAGGDVILHRGVQGMSRCLIKVKGNLISKFIESASVQAEGYITADSIFNSNISAKGDVIVTGRGGSIIGGVVRSSTMIEATSIGTAMGSATTVEVGIDPSEKQRIKELDELIKNKTAEVEKIDQLLTVFRKKQDMGKLDQDKVVMLSQFTKSIILGKTEIKTLSLEYEKRTLSLKENENAKIRVTKDIYAGTAVVVAGEKLILHDTKSHCMYMKKNGEITCMIW